MSPRVAVAIYLAAIVAANLTVAWFGPGISVVNAFLFIGLDLTLRDTLHELWRGRVAPMLGLILAGGALSYTLDRNAGIIAVASTVAFVLAATADFLVYRLLHRHPRWARVNGSNVVGAAVDSVVFPTIAFGGFMPWLTLAQWAAKVGGGLFWFWALEGWRAVSQRRRAA